LLARGQPVRVLSRSAARARQALGNHVAVEEGDIRSLASVGRALAGAKAIIIALSAFSPKLIRHLWPVEHDAVVTVLKEAGRAGVSRVVYFSVYDVQRGIAEGLDLEIAKIKSGVETALARSNLAWTVLGAAPSMQIFFSMIRGSTMMVPGGGPPALPTISPADVGEIAAQTVLRDDLCSERIRMVGPEAISFPEAARRISVAVGREIGFRKIPLLPLRLAAVVTRPVNPFLYYMVQQLTLLRDFPVDIVSQAREDHRRLLDTFDYVPTALEMEAKEWSRQS
jgi:uncharacterized protein YbjT (DUF2867 family)